VLVDLMTHLFRVYVLDRQTELQADLELAALPKDLTRLNFPQLLLYLQMNLELEELGLFRVSGRDVYVTLGSQEFNLLAPTPNVAALAASASQAAAPPTPAPEPPPRQRVAARPNPPVMDEAPPSSPLTGEPDFDIDDVADRHANTRQDRQAPAPQAPAAQTQERSSQGRGRGVSDDDLFGGRGRRPAATRQPSNTPISMAPPPPPPPIASRAPGDPTADEMSSRRARNNNSGVRSASAPDEGERRRRPGFEDGPPPLADGDKDIKSSNRFADIEWD